jgi:hypothetical protein
LVQIEQSEPRKVADYLKFYKLKARATGFEIRQNPLILPGLGLFLST